MHLGVPFALALFFAAAPGLAVAPALAQDKPAPAPEPMRFVLTRDAAPGCEPQCREWIAAQGAITKDTATELRRTLAALEGRKPPILIYSTGGTVEVAMEIGQLIRNHGLDIAVARTIPAKGDPGHGQIDERSPLCVSACTLVLAGGVRRIIPATSRIGVHQQTIHETETVTVRDYQVVRRREGDRIIETRELVKETKEKRVVKQEQATGEIDARMARYLDAMGLDRRFLELTVSTPASTMHYLKPDEMLATTIATEIGPANLAFAPLRAGLAPAPPAALIGTVVLGPHRGRQLRMEVSAADGFYPGTISLRLRLLSGDQPLTTRLRSASLTVPGASQPIVAINQDGSLPEGPMVAEVPRDVVCALGDRMQVTLRIEPADEDSPPTSWAKSASAADLLRLPALRKALC